MPLHPSHATPLGPLCTIKDYNDHTMGRYTKPYVGNTAVLQSWHTSALPQYRVDKADVNIGTTGGL